MATYRRTGWAAMAASAAGNVIELQTRIYGFAPTATHLTIANAVLGWIGGLALANNANEDTHPFPASHDVFGDSWESHRAWAYVETGIDTFDFADILREAGRGGLRRTSPAVIPSAVDVMLMWVPDPVPGRPAYGLKRDHCHVRLAGDDVWEIRVWDRLGPSLISVGGLYGSERYVGELLFKAYLETALLLTQERWPDVITDLVADYKRASWDTGPERGQVKFTTIERLKDMLYSARITDNQPLRAFTPERYAALSSVLFDKGRTGRPPSLGGSPLDPTFNFEGIVTSWSGPVHVPFPPRPKWTPMPSGDDFDGPDLYDHPVLISVDTGFSLTHSGAAWYWGGEGRGNRSGASLVPFDLDDRYAPDRPYQPGRISYARPPEPGTPIRFEIGWWPMADQPPGAPGVANMLALDPAPRGGQQNTPMKPGEFVFEMGSPDAEDGTGGPGLKQFGAATPTGAGIVWAIGRSGAATFDGYLFPGEFYGGRTTYRDLFGAARDHYVPIYFDFSKPGRWAFTLITPEHHGELALVFKWNALFGRTGVIPAGYPPVIVMPALGPSFQATPGLSNIWSWPRAKQVPAPPLPEGLVETQAAAGGHLLTGEPVHGSSYEPVQLLDPVEAGYHIVPDSRRRAGQPQRPVD